MSYRKQITEFAPEYDAKHVEAWMRSEFGTLDNLSREQFGTAVAQSLRCIEEGGAAMAEQLAQTYGL